jgi:nitroreductase
VAAPVLVLGIAALNFSRNDKPNKAAIHDLGLAAGNLVLEATARGLLVHQMIGILPDRSRELFRIPEGAEAVTGLAIGHRGDPRDLPEARKQRELGTRVRRPLGHFVFSGTWGKSAGFTG